MNDLFKNLNEEDIEFLKELSHELNTQPNDGNADPVFWGIRQEISSPPLQDGYGDTYVIWESSEGHEVYNSEDNNLDKFIEYMQQEDIEDEDGNELSPEDIRKEIEDNYLDEPYDFIREHNLEDSYGEGTINYEYQLTDQTGAFLTKRAAQEHIKLNHYHYNKPHTYAMTAWRNYEFEQLIKILKKLNYQK